MATGSSVRSTLQEISAKHLECSICTDRFKQPKLLDCQHTFCGECLVKYRDGMSPRATNIPCPVCRQETILPKSGIQGLKSNFHLASLIEEFELQEKVSCSAEAKLLCQVCDKGNDAKDRCMDCERNICKDCCKTHQQFPTLKTHKIASFDDIRQGKVTVTKQPDEYTCHEHEGVKKFYCKTCDELICQGCTVVDHQTATHDVTGTGTASREYRESLKKYFPALDRDIQDLDASLRETTAAKKMVNVKTAKARKGVQDRTAEVIAVIAKIKAEEKKLLDEITNQAQEQNKRLDEHEKSLKNMLLRKKHSLKTSQEVSSNASDSDFLSLYPVIKNDMDKLIGQPAPKAAGLKSHPVFVKSQKLDIDLGKVMVEDTWDMCQSFGKQGQGEGEFEAARGIAAAADPDEIVVADWKNKRVVICDKQGKTKGSISVISDDVKALSDGWVVSSLSVLKVYKRDRTLAYEFRTIDREAGKTTVHVVSLVLLDNGNIIAGDDSRKVLTEHQPGSKGKLIRTIPVSLQPDYLAVLNNGRIVISDWEQGLAGIVDVSDGKAAEVATIQPTIDGKPVKRCGGVCSNSSGIYLAVVRGYVNTGHIHHYNCAGQFVSCVAQGLFSPCGITFTADGQQLAVADFNSVKIYRKV
ncbi:E3 ubiquitin-protein ligase TRIM56-like [Patiria miniata]|uniref:Tripartite motif-containing protein 2-like n=1 Tax=Patiria miniata TaxID=46514 RepID=A0A914ANC1_PATMI|nr:E3 ubiquitin-protein ligase TRIM56-like [Patiria miniata]